MASLKSRPHPEYVEDLVACALSVPTRPPALRALHREIAICTFCPSMKPWRQFGPEAYGNPFSGFLLVGEAPGFQSWRKGRRFTGPAGRLIRRALRRVGHPRYRELEDLLYMTDAVKCHPAPPGRGFSNRSPRRSEINRCAGYLERELDLLQPSVIVTFGKTAAEQVAFVLARRRGPAALRMPEVISFPHPSPRNQIAIRRRYRTLDALEREVTRVFRRLISRLAPLTEVGPPGTGGRLRLWRASPPKP
jgi:uracil-DNA glycosylase family 4